MKREAPHQRRKPPWESSDFQSEEHVKEDPAVDVGMGMDPALVGHGHGAAFGQTVLDHLAETCPGRPLRAVVQAWNQHSLRTTSRLGFEEVGELTTMQDGRPVAYRIVVKRGTGQVPV